MSHKTFDNNLATIWKRKVALKLNKLAYIGLCILDLSKALMYEFYYDYIENKYNNKSIITNLLLTDIDSLMYEIKTETVYGDFNSNKECLILVIIQLSQNTDSLNKLIIEKMKDETRGFAIEEKPKIYSLLIDNNEHKKSKRCK